MRLWRTFSRPLFATVLIVGTAGLARAGDDAAKDKEKSDARPSTFGVQVENDLFGDGHDRYYTNGVQLTFSSGDRFVPDWYKMLLDRIPGITADDDKQYVVALGQQMFTPQDTTRTDPDPTDRPYAGWLFGSLGAVVTSKGSDLVQNVSLDLGVVGPASLAGYTQRRWHTLIGVPLPRGWGKQLHNEPGVLLTYQARERLPILDDGNPVELDVLPSAGVALGNVLTQGSLGVAVRFGRNLSLTYGPAFIRPSLPAAAIVRRKGEFGWNFFAGVEGRAVGHNIFLDGNTFGASRSVDKKNLVLDWQAGVEVILGSARLTFTQILRSPEFAGQHKATKFGSLSLSYIF